MVKFQIEEDDGTEFLEWSQEWFLHQVEDQVQNTGSWSWQDIAGILESAMAIALGYARNDNAQAVEAFLNEVLWSLCHEWAGHNTLGG